MNSVKRSIQLHGWIRNPIITNEKMEIIEGQARTNALKELGYPIEFVVHRGATIEDCIALNIKQKNWKIDDYVHCYAQMGYEHYVFLEKVEEKYKGLLTNSTIIQIAGSATGDKSGNSNAIKNGDFKIVDRESLDSRMNYCIDMLSIIGKEKGRIRLWTDCFKFIYYCDLIDNNKMKNRLNSRINQVHPIATSKQGITELQSLYNSDRGTNIFFYPEYAKYKKRMW